MTRAAKPTVWASPVKLLRGVGGVLSPFPRRGRVTKVEVPKLARITPSKGSTLQEIFQTPVFHRQDCLEQTSSGLFA